jgi:hypothetical protein
MMPGSVPAREDRWNDGPIVGCPMPTGPCAPSRPAAASFGPWIQVRSRPVQRRRRAWTRLLPVKIYLANDLAADARVRVVLPSRVGQRGIFTTEVDDEPVVADLCRVREEDRLHGRHHSKPCVVSRGCSPIVRATTAGRWARAFETDGVLQAPAWRPAAAAPLEGLDLLATLANGPSTNLSRRYRLWFANRHPLL